MFQFHSDFSHIPFSIIDLPLVITLILSQPARAPHCELEIEEGAGLLAYIYRTNRNRVNYCAMTKNNDCLHKLLQDILYSRTGARTTQKYKNYNFQNQLLHS